VSDGKQPNVSGWGKIKVLGIVVSPIVLLETVPDTFFRHLSDKINGEQISDDPIKYAGNPLMIKVQKHD